MVYIVQWMDIPVMRHGGMLNKIFLILFVVLIVNCSGSRNNFTELSDQSLTQLVDVENPVFLTIMLNKYLLYSNKLTPTALKKHNAAIHTALMNPKNGVIYYWQHKKTKGIDKLFFGRVKIVYSSRDRRGICRTWIEEIGRDNKYIFSSTSTACLNKDQTKYVLANEFFYDKM